jgi:phosphoribosylformimino-5-aminoimidazole carboxamide ribotide isomerase
MILIPTLELLGGKLVRLVGGSETETTVLSENPLETARELHSAGSMFLHVVDLDAMFGIGNNNDVLRRLSKERIPYQVRGGVRTAQRATELLRLGADRVVLGDLPFRDWSAARKLVKSFGLRVVATLDVVGNEALGDMESDRRLDLDQALQVLLDTGVEHIIYNSVESAGEDAYLDLTVLERVMSHGWFQVYTRCTVHTPEELYPLLELESRGLRGVILNHALASDCVPIGQLLESADASLTA